MTKDHTQGVFIRFIDFRGELLLRASAIDGVAPRNAVGFCIGQCNEHQRPGG